MNRNIGFLIFGFVGLVLSSCQQERLCEVKWDIEPIDILDVNADLSKVMDSPEALIAWAEEHPVIANEFLQRNQYPSDNIWADRVIGLFTDAYFDSLALEVERVFGDLHALENEIATAFAGIKNYYPDFSPPKVMAIFTGFANDMIVSDSLIVIGLDYYLGQDARFRPNHFPKYILEKYTPDYIVPSIVLLLSKDYNAVVGEDKSMLADMIFYGKAYYFAEKVLPCTPKKYIFGYTDEEITDINKNEEIIWSFFLYNDLLYTTSDIDKQKFLSERPGIPEIGEKCPGRIGCWIGYNLVMAYEKEQDASLQQLMANPDARKIMQESSYTP